MQLTLQQIESIVARYQALECLIQSRQQIENLHSDLEPYKSYPTDYTFLDVHGLGLIHYAILLNKIDKVKELIEVCGISVTQMSNNQINPLLFALTYGKVDIVEYFLQSGMLIAPNQRSYIDDKRCLEIYDREGKKLLTALLLECPRNIEKCLQIATELGELDILKSIIEDKDSLLINLCAELNLYHIAIKNNHEGIIKWLLNKKVPLEHKDELQQTALHIAVDKKNLELTKLLLENGANINAQDSVGRTPLLVAIQNGDIPLIKTLTAYPNCDLYIRTYSGDSIFHYASVTKIDLDSLLAKKDTIETLKQQNNIYGITPDKYVNFIKINSGISQDNIIKKIKFYLSLNYRDKAYLRKGYCNGFVFLHNYYDSYNKQNLFFEILNNIANWDGEEKSLSLPLKNSTDKNGANLNQLIEEFLGQLVLFQACIEKDIGVSQDDRDKQIAFLGKENFSFLFRAFNFNLTKSQIQEFLHIFKELPSNYYIEVIGGKHTTTFKVDINERLSYFDPNFYKKLEHTYDSSELVDIIINTKYKQLNQYDADFYQLRTKLLGIEISSETETFDIGFMCYHFLPDRKNNYNYFPNDALPKNKNDVLNFTKSSPNKFTHLHIACLTNSKDNIRQLINDGYCDVNQKNLHGVTSFDIAYDVGDWEMCEILLSSPTFKLDNPYILNKIYYRDGYTKLLSLVISNLKVNNLFSLFNAALERHDIDLLKELVVKKKISFSFLVMVATAHLKQNPFDTEALNNILPEEVKEKIPSSSYTMKNDQEITLFSSNPSKINAKVNPSISPKIQKYE